MGSTKLNWGRFSELSVSTINSGPILTYTDGAVCRGEWLCIQYRSHGTYTQVKKYTQVINTRHVSGEAPFLVYECSRARVIFEYSTNWC